MEAEIRRMLLQAIERQELQAAPEEKRERDLEEILASASGRNQPGQYLDFRLPASRTAREQISIVSNYLDCANLLPRSWETDINLSRIQELGTRVQGTFRGTQGQECSGDSNRCKDKALKSCPKSSLSPGILSSSLAGFLSISVSARQLLRFP